MSKLYALSIKQPWASLIVSGRKSIEIRSWPTRLRGRILIHAARVPDSREEAWKWVSKEVQPLTQFGGGIIGEAYLRDCLTYPSAEQFQLDSDRHLNDPSWFRPKGLFGFVFEQVSLLPFRPLPGNVRFFTVEETR